MGNSGLASEPALTAAASAAAAVAELGLAGHRVPRHIAMIMDGNGR
jgi:undecaprenyl pyrophosphate synthase